MSEHPVRLMALESLEVRLLLAAGDPDLAFSGDGRAALSFPGATFTIIDTGVAPDGKVVVGGTKGGNMALARLNQDGTLDTTFGNGGLYESTRREKVTSLVVQGDGKIVMGFGVSPFPYTDLAIGRLLANGSGFDAGFGNNGIADAGTERFYSSGINDVAVQRDGKIIGGGNVDDSLFIDYEFAVVRYLADGTLDNTFDGDGVAVHEMGTDLDKITAVTIDYNGSFPANPLYGTIVAVGGQIGSDPSGVVEPHRFRILRLRTDGTPDPAFDGDGKLTSPDLSGLGIEYARGVVVQPGGKVVVAGTSISGSDPNLAHFLVARYTSAGVLDTSFGLAGGGVSEVDLGGRDEVGGIALGYHYTLGNLIVAGSRNGLFAAIALAPDGQLDTRFSGDGILSTSIPGQATGLFATQDLYPPARRLIFAGGAGQVARYVDVGSLITVGTLQPYMHEQGEVGTSFIVGRTTVLPFSETIFLSTSGTATPRGTLRDFNGQNIVFGDGQTSTTHVIIPAGASFVNVILTPIDDTRVEGDETITFTVGTTLLYDAGVPAATTLVIRDNDYFGGPEVIATSFNFDTYPQNATITFNQNVQASFTVGDLVITGPGGTTPNYSLDYNSVTNTGTVVFYSGLVDGNYTVRVKGSGIFANGQPMAADYVFGFFMLRADANHDRHVDLADFGILRANFGGTNRTFSQGDFNYDTLVNLADFGILRASFGTFLPPPDGNLFGGDGDEDEDQRRL